MTAPLTRKKLKPRRIFTLAAYAIVPAALATLGLNSLVSHVEKGRIENDAGAFIHERALVRPSQIFSFNADSDKAGPTSFATIAPQSKVAELLYGKKFILADGQRAAEMRCDSISEHLVIAALYGTTPLDLSDRALARKVLRQTIAINAAATDICQIKNHEPISAARVYHMIDKRNKTYTIV
jgi:hypothetical protein